MPAETIRARGQVQGVGFRPFVWRLAAAHGIAGDVRNDGAGVLIRAVAEAGRLDAFAAALREEAPPLARIDALERAALADPPPFAGFSIVQTDSGATRTHVTPDAAACAACRAEIGDASGRRHGYAFTNCTHCGPRFSIVERIPYDRASTTMRAFAMCADCRAEYGDPADRRFHAQPIACPACGPRLWLEHGGVVVPGDAIAEASAMLRAGKVVAVKGLGGFHLACDARNEAAVAGLRRRKRRPAKPFALMAPDLAVIARHARIGPAEAALLADVAAPVVLIEAAGEALAPSVAPGQWALGWMLPYTPLHILLLQAFGSPLVMTSGNVSGEPQVVGNDEARAKLGSFADAFLMHDREIARRLDDSVARVSGGELRMLRRARGYAPGTVDLPAGLRDAPPVAAYGGELKSAICLARDGQAMLSHHLGDLTDPLAAEEFVRADADYAALFGHRPAAIACDLHRAYRSTAHAEARAEALGLPLVRVQHHHAHVAAAMVDGGWPVEAGQVLGVALDGLGLGEDGTLWGGEFLLCTYAGYRRVGWLKPVALPGGNAAQREPWRNLLARLDAAGLAGEAERLLPGKPLATLRAAIAKGVNAPLSSSAGRLFDSVAAAAGLAPERMSYEGEAAMLLETAARADRAAMAVPYSFAVAGPVLDPAPMWRELLDDRAAGAAPARIAARFHAGLAAAATDFAAALADAHGARAIALTGGVMQNATLLELCLERLAGRTVLTQRETPPNDGSLALGQAAVAAARLAEGG